MEIAPKSNIKRMPPRRYQHSKEDASSCLSPLITLKKTKDIISWQRQNSLKNLIFPGLHAALSRNGFLHILKCLCCYVPYRQHPPSNSEQYVFCATYIDLRHIDYLTGACDREEGTLGASIPLSFTLIAQ